MNATKLNQEYGFRDLALVPPGHFSPVGMSRDGSVYGTFVPAHTGEAVATRVISGGDFSPLTDSLSLIEAVSAEGTAVGSFGYGERGFFYKVEAGIQGLDSKFEFSSINCVGADGSMGGSATVDGVERAVLYRGGEILQLPDGAQSILAISQSGLVAGKTSGRSLYLWRPPSGPLESIDVEGQANWVAGFLPTDGLVLTVQKDFLNSHAVVYRDQQFEQLPGLGGKTTRVVAVGWDGAVILSGTNVDGQLVYGVYREGVGVTVLDPDAMPGMQVDSLNGVGPNGEVIGLARGSDGTHVIVASPLKKNSTHAAVEFS